MLTVAITGASAGIGRAIAKAFAQQGANVGLIARSETALIDVQVEVEKAGGKALVLPCDVSDSQALDTAAERLEQEMGVIEVWINCAMVTVFSEIKDILPEEYQRVTDVTYHGYVFGTLSALRRMRPRNRGHIIQIGSALAYRSIPLQAAYCGAKHAIKGFTDTLRAELLHENSNVQVTMVQLPAFNTPQFIWSRNHTHHSPQPLPPIHDPALAAEAVVWVVDNPQREIWVGWPSWKAIIGQKLFPGLLDRYVAKTAWEGQFTQQSAEPDPPNNLFHSLDSVHSEHGPFSNREITQKPVLWQVRNQNLWINTIAFGAVALAFIVGFTLG